MQELDYLIREGSYQQLLDVTGAWNDKQKREAQKWIAAYWKENSKTLRFDPWREPSAERMRLIVACAATARDAKQALSVTQVKEYRDCFLYYMNTDAKGALIHALARHGRDWVADYVALAASGKSRKLHNFDVLMALIDGFGLPFPEDDAFFDLACAGFWSVCYHEPHDKNGKEIPFQRSRPLLTITPGNPPEICISEMTAGSPAEALATLGHLRSILSAAFSRPEGVLKLLGSNKELFINAIRQLLARSTIDRIWIFDLVLAALTRSDSVSAQRLQAELLLTSEPPAADLAFRANTLRGLLASGHGSAAEVSQTLLRHLDQAQALDGEFFLGACQMVFARKEKGLLSAQLDWVIQRLGIHPAQAKATMRGLLEGLIVEDYTLQKKVAAALVKHWPGLAPVEQSELREVLPSLLPAIDPNLGAELSSKLGGEAPRRTMPTAMSAPLREARPLQPFEPIVADIPSIKEVLARHASAPTVLVCEQLIDVALRLAAEDRQSLKLALRECGCPYAEFITNCDCLSKLLCVAAFGILHRYKLPGCGNSTPASEVARRRFAEIALALQEGRPYALISRPGFDNGAIQADDLLQRLQKLANNGQEAEPLDFLVALMRTQQPDSNAINALRAIGTPQAKVAADFFAAGGMGQMRTTWQIVKPDPTVKYRNKWIRNDQSEVCVTLHGMPTLPAMYGIPASWSDGFTPETAPDIWEFDLDEPFINGVMPNNGEILAALHLWGFRKACNTDFDTSGGKATALALPAFLAARGPAGPAMHLAILFALSANEPEARLAGSDALLELIAQDRFDSTLASELTAATLQCGSSKAGRLAKSLAPAVDAGIVQALWPMIRAAVITLLDFDSPPTGTPDLLALASRVVTLLGVRESIGVLAQTAACKGNSKMLTEARRLHELLSAP